MQVPRMTTSPPRRALPKRRNLSPPRRNLPSKDSLDIDIEELAKKYVGEEQFILPYWYRYKDEMLKILKEYYPMSRIPKWVNYELFKFETLFKMAETLFDDIIEEDPDYFSKEDDEIIVDFSHILGITMCCVDVDEDDRIQELLGDIGISITVKYFKGG
jgi:hypothetical protein